MDSSKTNSNFPYVERKDLGNGNCLHLINIEKIDSKLEKFIDDHIIKVCEGSANTDLPTVKKRLEKSLASKEKSNLEMGYIAEFFTHLYLNEIGFKQEFLFLNLEENALKKGFDGYYSYLDEEWIYESKSGNISSKGISHPRKINESYRDLESKISTEQRNNPWQNAYNHARHGDINSPKKIYENLKKLSKDFISKKFPAIKDFNIIPGSTIFMEDSWKDMKLSDLETELKNLILKFNFKKIHIICVNKKSVELFLEYLKK